MYRDTHTSISIVTGVSKEWDVYTCECTWDSSCELKRDSASMIKYSRGRNIHIHCLYLLRETRTRIAPCTIVLYVCIERNSLLSFSLSFFLAIAVYMATTKDEEETKKKKYDILSIIWLVDFFFASSFSLHFIVICLLACFFFLILPTRFVDKRPRKGRSHPIEEKKQVISSFASEGVFFVLSAESNTQYPLLSLLLAAFLSLSLFLSFSLPVLVCKSSSSYTHTHTHIYTRTIKNNTRFIGYC